MRPLLPNTSESLSLCLNDGAATLKMVPINLLQVYHAAGMLSAEYMYMCICGYCKLHVHVYMCMYMYMYMYMYVDWYFYSLFCGLVQSV